MSQASSHESKRGGALVAIIEEERTLRDQLRKLWREKTFVIAALADEARDASLREIAEGLKRQRKAKR